MSKLFRLTLAFVAATATSYAQPDHSSSVKLNMDVRAGAASIPAGHYTLRRVADSGDRDLTISGEKHQYSITITVKQSPVRLTGNPAVLTHSEGNTEVLEGFQVKDTLLMLR
jgi:hypothetical protein